MVSKKEFDSTHQLIFREEVDLDPVILAPVPFFGHAFLSGYLLARRKARGILSPVCLTWWGWQHCPVCGEETQKRGEKIVVPSIRLLHLGISWVDALFAPIPSEHEVATS